MRKRRIAFLSEHASPLALLGSVDAGGQNVYVDEVSRNLASLGYAVDVFTRRDSPDVPEIVDWAPGVRVVHVDAGPPRFVLKDHLWPFMPDFRDQLLLFSERERIRYDVLHGNFWMSGWVAIEVQQRLGTPTVQIFHAMGKTKQRHQREADTSPEVRIAVEHEIVERADRLIAQCPSETEEMVGDYGADPRKVVVIPSAVNTDVYRPVGQAEARRALGIDPDRLLIVYVGRMLPRKDVRNVLRALAVLLEAADLPVDLLLVGGESAEPDPVATPEIGVLQGLAEELGITDRIRFVGKRQPDVLHLYYCAGDVAVTTPWYEPFGLTPLEAQACGRPVVGSAVGGITFTIVDGETGCLVPPRDPRALAEKLRHVLTHREERLLMGVAARKRVERDFTWPVVARRTADLYEQLAGQALATSGHDQRVDVYGDR